MFSWMKSPLLRALGLLWQVAGQYIAHGRPKKPSRQGQDAALARRLWSVSCQLTGVQEEAITLAA